VNGSLVSGNEPLVRVDPLGGRESSRVSEVAMNALAVSDRKYWSSGSKKAFLPPLKRLVDVHAGSVHALQRLRHEGGVPPYFIAYSDVIR
jgi:hypothetical protein